MKRMKMIAPRRTLVGALLATTLLVSPIAPAFAQSAPSSYQLGSGDVVGITVFGEEGLSGQYEISGTGTISYPLVGEVEVAGKTAAQVAELLSHDLAEFVPGLSVTVGVARYAPVFVLGDVQTPGRYDFRPGMIALELFALGGGLARSTAVNEAGEGAALQLIGMRQEFNDNVLQMLGLEASRARLQAELDGSETMAEDIPQSDPALRAVQQRVRERELGLFALRKSGLAAEAQALSAQERSYSDEIESISKSMVLHEDEIRLIGEDVDASAELVKRGLTSRSNLRETERQLSATRRDALELGSYLARAKQNLLVVQQRKASLVTDRRNEAAAQLQTVELELARKRARNEALAASMTEVAMSFGSGISRQQGMTISYSIVRRAADGFEEVAANEREEIRPGDILRAEASYPVRTTAEVN